ncbi:hypothetical protein HW35_08800 [Bacillus sp. X1(2014)]|jgi:teichuronic acid biosynthesis glycosyltransferase TuaH|nr:hypothetical protein HW35_08800 [Bacillus sp. X1(2014)]
MNSIDHYIVAPSPWDGDGLKFRRHRIAEYLLSQSSTNAVYWIYPTSIHSLQNGKNYLGSLFSKVRINNNGLRMISFIDLKGFVKHNENGPYYEKKFISKIINNKENSKKNAKYLWFTHPAFPWLATDPNLKWDKIIYDCSDLWTSSFVKRTGIISYLENIRIKKIERAENIIIKSANKVIATSDFLSKKIKDKFNKEVLVVENGVEFEAFINKTLDKEILEIFNNIPKPRLGFVGGLKHKIDFNLLFNIARKEKFSIVLVGPITDNVPEDLEKLLELENVYYLGAVKPDKVPQYMRCLDVGLLPYKEIEYNKAISPLKLFEYIAAGIPTIGCGLPMTTKYHKEGIYTHISRNEDLFIRKCYEALNWNNEELVKKREEAAKLHSWSSKLEKIYNYVNNL